MLHILKKLFSDVSNKKKDEKNSVDSQIVTTQFATKDAVQNLTCMLDDKNITQTAGNTEDILIDSQDIIEPENEEKSPSFLDFNVLDLSKVIDICAEIRAVEEYDKMMRENSQGNFFQKAGSFFKKSFYRMGRDAWIEGRKRQVIKQLQEELKSGTITTESLEKHINSGIQSIETNSYLNHEKVLTDESVPEEMQNKIDEWLNIIVPIGMPDPTKYPNNNNQTTRNQILLELKDIFEKNYPYTANLSQLEKSLLKLEKAKIEGELQTIQAKLNILDIGRIEYGYGKREKSFTVGIIQNIEKSNLPKWIKGFVQHPNTAAVISALATRWGIGITVAGGAALGFAGGLLAPVAIGSIVGGYLANGRAKREIKDRNAQNDRRGAFGYETGSEQFDGKSSDNLNKQNEYQHSTMDLYNIVVDYVGQKDVLKTEALTAGVYYLVKHKVGREQGLNMLQYDSDKSVSSQHLAMIQLLNQTFPGLVQNFNNGTLFDVNNTSQEAQLTQEKYNQIKSLAEMTLLKRDDLEKKYAMKQGLIYAGVAAGVGTTVGAILHGFGVGSTPASERIISEKQIVPGVVSTDQIPSKTITHYPDNLIDYKVTRDFWYDNNTSKFDYTELMVHANKTGDWSVAYLLGKSPFGNGQTMTAITQNDFGSGKIQAIITPKLGGPSFALPINENGKILIPESMKTAFQSRSFAFLEIGQVTTNGGNLNLQSIATVKGNGTMIFDKITTLIPGETIEKTGQPQIIPAQYETIPEVNTWYGVPFGGNKYHHLNKGVQKSPIGELLNDDHIYIDTNNVDNKDVCNNDDALNNHFSDITDSLKSQIKQEEEGVGCIENSEEEELIQAYKRNNIQLHGVITEMKKGNFQTTDYATLNELFKIFKLERKKLEKILLAKNINIPKTEIIVESLSEINNNQEIIEPSQDNNNGEIVVKPEAEKLKTGLSNQKKQNLTHQLNVDEDIIEIISSDISLIAADCELAINIPIYNKEPDIYATLKAYAFEQKQKGNSGKYEINLFCYINKNIRKSFDGQTLKDIRDFKRNNPNVRINLIQNDFEFKGRHKKSDIDEIMSNIVRKRGGGNVKIQKGRSKIPGNPYKKGMRYTKKIIETIEILES